MLKNAASKVMLVGRATVFLVGIAMILALVLGAASPALGADGKPFLLSCEAGEQAEPSLGHLPFKLHADSSHQTFKRNGNRIPKKAAMA